MKIVILASGGDAPGMNMCIHKLTKRFTFLNKNEVYACKYGFKGLIDSNFEKMTTKQTRKHKNEAGVFIKTSRCLEFKSEEGLKKAVNNLKNFNVDYVIVLGGDGSLKGSVALMQKKIKVIFIPATIDKDLNYDTYSLGFYTAVGACCQYIHDVRPTMDAFDRACIYEIMGRDCSKLTNFVGDISKADLVINKENVNQIDWQILKKKYENKPSLTIVLQERILPPKQIEEKIISVTGGNVRYCVVGYVQRGKTPSKIDKIYAKRFAKVAYHAFLKKKDGVQIGIDAVGEKILKLS